MRFGKLSVLPLFVSFAVPWAASCSSGDKPEGTGATGGTAPTAGMSATSGGMATAAGGMATAAGGMATAAGGMATAAGGMATAAGGMATAAGGTGGAAAGTGGSGGNNVAGDTSMGGEAGMMEVGGSAGSGMAGSGTAGSGTAGSGTAGSGTGGASGGTFTLTIAGFTPMAGCSDDMRDSCAVWPRDLQQFMSGPNMSPAMTWTGAPAGTQSFAVVLNDESVPNVHWALWNIQSSVMMLPADIPKTSAMPATPAGSQQANFSSGDGYFGPGSECNVYSFTIYALSVPTFTPAANTAASVRMGVQALGAQLLGEATVWGRQNLNGTCNP